MWEVEGFYFSSVFEAAGEQKSSTCVHECEDDEKLTSIEDFTEITFLEILIQETQSKREELKEHVCLLRGKDCFPEGKLKSVLETSDASLICEKADQMSAAPGNTDYYRSDQGREKVDLQHHRTR